MKRATLLVSAVLAIGVTAPALADYVRLGSVDVSFRRDTDMMYTSFGGRMESLRLTASRSDIFCRSIVVKFENGETQNVFSGRLDERRPVDVDLRGRARKIEKIRFQCRSDEFTGGRIYIAGEVGRYYDEWRRHRDWDRMWSGVFGGMGRPGGWDRDRGRGWDRDRDRDRGWDRNEWVSLGTQSFEGRNDRESMFTGWAGRRVERIGLRPVDGDARCMAVVAQYSNGDKDRLISGMEYLERGRVRVFDVPGRSRNLTKLFLRCRAVGDFRVGIEILTRR